MMMIVRRIGTWPITIRVALATAVLMILLGIVAAQQVLSALTRLQDERLQEFARLHVEGLAVALGPFALHRDIWEVYDTLDRARTHSSGGRIVFTVVADEHGKVLAATDTARAAVDSNIAAFAQDALPPDEITARTGSALVRVLAPLTVQDRLVGQVVTELDVSDLIAERRTTTFALLAANAAATLILALAGYFLVARMLNPIELLASHMGKAGGSPQPIPAKNIPRSDTVLVRLLHNFNDMAGAIGARAEAERRLAERERFVSLGRLSSSLAHEINNPLGGLLNATDTIRSYADRQDVVLKSADLLDRGLLHLRDVSRAILEENRLDRSGQRLKRADFDDLRLLFEPETSARNQSLEWDIQANDDILNPLASAPVRQIALNLLLNASSAAPQGGTVSFLCHSNDNGQVELKVCDDGPGLSQADQDRLMSQAPIAPGGGVGLRLVRDLTAGLRGTLVYARAQQRTEIVISLPLSLLMPGAGDAG